MPEDVDAGLAAIRIAQVLGGDISALDVAGLPPIWIRNAMISLKVEAMQHEKAMKKAQERRKKSAPKPARRRR